MLCDLWSCFQPRGPHRGLGAEAGGQLGSPRCVREAPGLAFKGLPGSVLPFWGGGGEVWHRCFAPRCPVSLPGQWERRPSGSLSPFSLFQLQLHESAPAGVQQAGAALGGQHDQPDRQTVGPPPEPGRPSRVLGSLISPLLLAGCGKDRLRRRWLPCTLTWRGLRLCFRCQPAQGRACPPRVAAGAALRRFWGEKGSASPPC